ncbi:AsnC family protein, partial [Rhizobium phaseoli]
MISVDDLDPEILSALRHNARISVSALAATTGASRATVAARIDR